VKLWRIVDQHGRVYRSNQFRGYYEDKVSAERAMKRLPKTQYGGYDYDRKRPKPPVQMTYTLQEADVTWTSLTSSTSSPTSASSSMSLPQTKSTFISTTDS